MWLYYNQKSVYKFAIKKVKYNPHSENIANTHTYTKIYTHVHINTYIFIKSSYK